MFNYQNLEDKQFEELCRDIMEVITGKQLHVFAKGRDGGVDITDDSNEHNIVVQVKHYQKSSFSDLIRSLKKEFEKVEKLAPKKYYICVSQSLTDENVNTIFNMFSDYMEATDNILTLDDIDKFLHEPENIHITRKHSKLWIESGTTLELILESFPALKINPNVININAKCLTEDIPEEPEIGLIGRDEILGQVRKALDGEKNIALVCGLGGIGKTAVMAKICNSIIADGNEDTHVAWITCGKNYKDDLLILRESLGVPKELNQEEAFGLIIRRLQNLKGVLYLFLDDLNRVLDKNERSCYNSLRPNVRIMITARHKIKGIPFFELDELEADYALDMFYDYYERDQERKYEQEAREIINTESVRRHTLLIELLAKAANASFGNLIDFHNKLKEKGFLNVSNRKFNTGLFDNATIEESVRKLYLISDLSPDQQHVMRLFSIFTPEKVIYGAIEEWADLNQDAVDSLIRLGWLNRSENGFVIHQIIKDSLFEQVGEVLRLEDYGELLDKVVDTDNYLAVSNGYKVVWERLNLPEDIAKYLDKRQKALVSDKSYDKKNKKALIRFSKLLYAIAVVNYELANYQKALGYYEKALNIRERVLGTDHPDTATTYNNIAIVYSNQGDYQKALGYYEKALNICERVLGTDHPDTATTYNNIAIVYSDQGDYQKALGYYEKALNIRERVLGTDHPDTATTYNNIAIVYRTQRDYLKAMEYCEKALNIRERVFGTDHPDTAKTYNNIATVYYYQGDYSKALGYYEKAHNISERVLGSDHPYTVTTYSNIASVYSDQGDYPKALGYYEKALNIRERVLGTDHPDTAKTYNNIATVYYYQGDYSKALGYYEKALNIRERVLGSDHPDTATTYSNIATVYYYQGDYPKALGYYEKAHNIRERVFGNETRKNNSKY